MVVEWVMESGQAEADAAYVLTLGTHALRQRELLRLGRVHGEGYRWNVERAVKENWSASGALMAPLPLERHADPRAAARERVGLNVGRIGNDKNETSLF